MSGISSDWYARLEQGRESQPSHATMVALAKTLNLNEAERRHLFILGSAANKGAFELEQVPDHLDKMINALSTPAYLTGARKDLLCWNNAAVELFRDFSAIPVSKRNTLFQMFTEPRLRTLFVDWEDDARAMLESFRASYDLWSHAPQFEELVTDLSERSAEFREWWKHHAVRTRTSGIKRINHPGQGIICLQYSTFQCLDAHGLTLVLYTGIDYQL